MAEQTVGSRCRSRPDVWTPNRGADGGWRRSGSICRRTEPIGEALLTAAEAVVAGGPLTGSHPRRSWRRPTRGDGWAAGARRDRRPAALSAAGQADRGQRPPLDPGPPRRRRGRASRTDASSARRRPGTSWPPGPARRSSWAAPGRRRATSLAAAAERGERLGAAHAPAAGPRRHDVLAPGRHRPRPRRRDAGLRGPAALRRSPTASTTGAASTPPAAPGRSTSSRAWRSPARPSRPEPVAADRGCGARSGGGTCSSPAATSPWSGWRCRPAGQRPGRRGQRPGHHLLARSPPARHRGRGGPARAGRHGESSRRRPKGVAAIRSEPTVLLRAWVPDLEPRDRGAGRRGRAPTTRPSGIHDDLCPWALSTTCREVAA